MWTVSHGSPSFGARFFELGLKPFNEKFLMTRSVDISSWLGANRRSVDNLVSCKRGHVAPTEKLLAFSSNGIRYWNSQTKVIGFVS